MPRYSVFCYETETITNKVWYEVIADSPEEAEEKVENGEVIEVYVKEDSGEFLERDIQEVVEID